MPSRPYYTTPPPASSVVTDIVNNPTSPDPASASAVYALMPTFAGAYTMFGSNVFTVPADIKTLAIFIGGAGGGGGSASASTGFSQSGGGGQAGAELGFLVDVTPGQIITFTRQQTQTPADTGGGQTEVTIGNLRWFAAGGGNGQAGNASGATSYIGEPGYRSGAQPLFVVESGISGHEGNFHSFYRDNPRVFHARSNTAAPPQWDNANISGAINYVIGAAGGSSSWGSGGGQRILRGSALTANGNNATGFCAGGGGGCNTGSATVGTGGLGGYGYASIWTFTGV